MGTLQDQHLETERFVQEARTNSGTFYALSKIQASDGRWVGHTSSRQGAKAIIKRFVLILGSLHLTLMAVLGIWLWSGPLTFSNHLVEEENSCAYDNAVLIILGQDVAFRSKAFQISSLIIYSVFLVPGLNLIIPVALFLGVYAGWYRWGYMDNIPRRLRSSRLSGLQSALSKLSRGIYFARRSVSFPAYFSLAILFAINLVFVVDIELTLQRNMDLQSGGNDDWGFGQILAILLLLLPFRDLVEAVLARRLKQRERELEEDLREAVRKGDLDGMRRAVERGIAFPVPGSEGSPFSEEQLRTMNAKV